ncbi:Uncharacterized protein APZ42_006563, partial [Daphnia magna]
MSTKIFTDIAVFDDVLFSNFQSIFQKYPSSLHRDSNLGSFASPANRLTITPPLTCEAKGKHVA